MSMDVQTSMRLPALLLTRADALIDKLHADPSLAMMGKMTRSKVLRLALSEGGGLTGAGVRPPPEKPGQQTQNQGKSEPRRAPRSPTAEPSARSAPSPPEPAP